jgi:hypothetical protein
MFYTGQGPTTTANRDLDIKVEAPNIQAPELPKAPELPAPELPAPPAPENAPAPQ